MFIFNHHKERKVEERRRSWLSSRLGQKKSASMRICNYAMDTL